MTGIPPSHVSVEIPQWPHISPAPFGEALCSLKTLKGQFRSAAKRYPLLSFIHAEAPVREQAKLLGPYPVKGFRTPNEDALSLLPITWPRPFTRHRHWQDPCILILPTGLPDLRMLGAYYIAQNQPPTEALRRYSVGVDRFENLAESSARCLLSFPSEVLDVLPPELLTLVDPVEKMRRFLGREPGPEFFATLKKVDPSDGHNALFPSARSASDSWTIFVLWLAWRGDSGSILKAERKARLGDKDIPWRATREEYERLVRRTPFLVHTPFDETRHNYSFIKNIFLCSALAIEAIERRVARLTVTEKRKAEIPLALAAHADWRPRPPQEDLENLRVTPFTARGGGAERFPLKEALVYPLHPAKHPMMGDFGYRSLISWRARWITGVVATGDIVEKPPVRADSHMFGIYRKLREISEVEAHKLLTDNGYSFPEAPIGSAPYVTSIASREAKQPMLGPSSGRRESDVGGQTDSERPIRRKKRGRPADTDQDRDRRIDEAWKTGQHKDHSGLARAMHLPLKEVKLALDRHRQRSKKARKT